MPRTTFMQVHISYRSALSSVFLLHDLELNYQGQTFQVTILKTKGLKNTNNTVAIRWKVRHLPSYGATATVVHHDLDLHSQGHTF